MKTFRIVTWMTLTVFLASCSVKSVRGTKQPVPPVKRTETPARTKTPAPVATPAPTTTLPLAPNVDAEINQQVLNLENSKNHIDLLKYIDQQLKRPEASAKNETLKLKAQEVIQSKLNESELDNVADMEINPMFTSQAYYELGQRSLAKKEIRDAEEFFNKSIEADANQSWSLLAQNLLAQIEATRKVEPRAVGVVLPLTGKHKNVAQKTLRGLQMGLGLYNNIPSSFKVAVADSEGNPDFARRGVEKLIREDNVISIVGPILSKNAAAVSAKASELGVPNINLTQKVGVTEAGENIFRNSLTSEMQIRFLVKTAFEELQLRKFAIIYPNDAYGVEYANIFWEEVNARGGQIKAAVSYSPKDTDFRDVAQRVVGSYYTDDRLDEARALQKDKQATGIKKSSREEDSGDLLPPIVDFDAVFIPDSAKAMGQIAAMLGYVGVRNIFLLGTNLWNIKGVEKRAGLFSENMVFVDSFYNQADSFRKSFFVTEYKRTFNEEPGLAELQGFDAGLLLRHLISQGYTSRSSLQDALKSLQNFPGSISSLSVTNEREVLRPLVAIRMQKGQPTTLKSSF